jgi:hypothetical protein
MSKVNVVFDGCNCEEFRRSVTKAEVKLRLCLFAPDNLLTITDKRGFLQRVKDRLTGRSNSLKRQDGVWKVEDVTIKDSKTFTVKLIEKRKGAV